MSALTPQERGIDAAPERFLPSETAAAVAPRLQDSGALSLHPKTAGTGLTSCLALLILWGVSYKLTVPVEIGAAFTSVLGFAGAYFAPFVERIQPKGN
jgi:hypothetical protein